MVEVRQDVNLPRGQDKTVGPAPSFDLNKAEILADVQENQPEVAEDLRGLFQTWGPFASSLPNPLEVLFPRPRSVGGGKLFLRPDKVDQLCPALVKKSRCCFDKRFICSAIWGALVKKVTLFS